MAERTRYYKQDGTEYDFSKEPEIKITQTSNADMNIGIPKKLTAVEWFAEVTAKLGYVSTDILKQAKQMEKEQIERAYHQGVVNEISIYSTPDAEQYYKEKYGTA